MKPRKSLTALLGLLTASGWGINGSNQVKAEANTVLGNMILAASHPAAKPGTMPGRPSGNVTWGEYEDPLEDTFILHVHGEWTTKGGLYRLGYSDVRVMVI